MGDGPRVTGAEAGGAGAGGSGAGGARAGGAGAGDTGAVDPGAGGVGAGGAVSGGTCARGTMRSQPFFVPLLRQVPNSFTARREPESRPASPVRAVHTGRHVPRPRPPPVPGTHAMALRPSSVPLNVPLLPPPESSLPSVPDPESDLARAASPTVSRLLATFVTDPCFQTTAASSLVAELVDFAAACRLDYATALVAESESAGPLSIGGECALGKDVHEDRQEDLECLAAAVPHLVAMFLALEGDPDAPDIPTPRSYAEAITVLSSGANIVDGNWIFRMKRPPGSLPSFKARYVARGFSQPQGVDYFQTFSPTPKMTTLRVLLHVAAQRDYELHSLDFSTAFLQGSLHEEIWLRRPPGFTRSFPVGTLWSLRRPVYSLRQAPHEWHDTLRTTLAALGFAPSTADPSLFLRTETSLPPFYVLVYVDVLIFATTDTEALALVMSELPKRHTCTDQGELRNYLGLQINRDRARRTITLTQSHMVHQVLQRFGFCTSGMGLLLGGRGLVVLTGHADASWVDDLATQRSSQSYTFSLGSGSVSWRSTRSSSVLSSSCEAEIYAGAMAAQELRWLTYLLTDLGEQPRSPLQRGQLRLAYVATRANTADIFTEALPPACFAFLDWSCDHLISVTPLLVGRSDILTWKEAPDLRAEFRAVQLLTFTVISRCCLPGMQIALKSCREYLDTGHRAWHFIESTYQVTDALYIGQLEEQLSHIRMGKEETAADYCNRARRILTTMSMAVVHYSTASYLTHVIEGLTSSYSLLKLLSLAPSTRATLNEDSLTSKVVDRGNARSLAAVVAMAGSRPKDVDKMKSAKDSGRGEIRRRECWQCGNPDHLSFECPGRSDFDDDYAKGGYGRSGSRRPRRGKNQPRKEKQSTKSSTSAKDANSSAGGKGRDDKEASCSLVGIVKPTVSLAPEAGEDF
ncbi:unnamed protein product [Closterium sp. NIES-53]